VLVIKRILGQVRKAIQDSVVPSPCHINGKTKRQFIKDLIRELSYEKRDIKSNLFGAIRRSGVDGWH
jgi:tRNA 2-thiocytidine biosynthesis protein TtcA